MSVSVNPPKTPVTEGSRGIALATLPNICKMPGPPAPFVPVPLPNIGKSGDSSKGYSKKVKIKGKKVAISGASFKSVGDMASKGTGGGIVSSNTHGPCKFISPGSMDVKFEGKNVHLLTDMVTNNGGPSGSPPNAATMMGVLQLSGLFVVVEAIDKCIICEQEHKALKESITTKGKARKLSNKYHLKVKDSGGDETMIGVLKCECERKLYANKSGFTNSDLYDAANEMKMISEQGNLNTKAIKKFIEERHGKKVAESTIRRIQTKKEKEIGADSNSFNEIGSCAAPALMILCLNDGGYPKEMTERWYSSSGKETGQIYKYQKVDKQKKIGTEAPRSFKPGESVPPCGTCEILLPILMCPEPGESKCTHKN